MRPRMTVPPGPRHAWRTALLGRTLARALPLAGPEAGSEAGPGALPLLDLGCGEGSLACRLAFEGHRVCALDLDPRRLARARERARAPGLRIAWVRADATRLPFADARFAGVAMGEVLEHLVRDDKALAEVARVLAPGAALALTVPAGPARYGSLDRAAGHQRRYDRARLRKVLEGSGLSVELLRGWGFPSGRVYDRWIQRPALLGQHLPSGSLVRWLARRGWVDRFWQALFDLDERVEAGDRGAGLIALARRTRAASTDPGPAPPR